ncbi:MAG TPA: hypothetical protein PKO05_08435 [Thermoanaerobaculia bacterium]|jgi:copper chaperone NosL|nr:hypothetical protein [Acidobacteriota bacterium]OQC36379.1 MAG: hypothetical protein BWX64_02137 [Acidobacteria bacterium ADurb.Bin051]HNU83442.1 hypothetical protein [Thermoanaerobaculia bacterium]HQP92648.1 hypothetical protein [Thermoanaerobaculia bacterium]
MSSKFVWGVVGLLVLLAAGAAVVVLQRSPTGPVEPAWDRQACAHCRMHLSEPPFAAQLRTAEGEVLYFDDPGCLFLWEAQQSRPPAAVYFRHLREPRWLAEAETGFLRVDYSPMGWGLGAVDRREPGTISPEEARQAVLSGPGKAAHPPGERAHEPAAH